MPLHCIFVMTGFDSNAKRFQKPFENEFGKSLQKKKRENLILSLLSSFRPKQPSRPAAVFPPAGPRTRPLLPPPSWAGPTWLQPLLCLLPLCR
jgi:hypothetical protein